MSRSRTLSGKLPMYTRVGIILPHGRPSRASHRRGRRQPLASKKLVPPRRSQRPERRLRTVLFSYSHVSLRLRFVPFVCASSLRFSSFLFSSLRTLLYASLLFFTLLFFTLLFLRFSSLLYASLHYASLLYASLLYASLLFFTLLFITLLFSRLLFSPLLSSPLLSSPLLSSPWSPSRP